MKYLGVMLLLLLCGVAYWLYLPGEQAGSPTRGSSGSFGGSALVLAAQFESFIHPLVIMLTVPLAMAGALIGLILTDSTLNIYSQIGLIILIGIAAKNGVLIVEFINQMRDQGLEFRQAIIKGAQIRFRPVVMTTISTVMGSLPLLLATGPGSNSRIVLGIVLFSGVSFATLFALFVVPVFYHLLARNTDSPNALARKLDAMRAQTTR